MLVMWQKGNTCLVQERAFGKEEGRCYEKRRRKKSPRHQNPLNQSIRRKVTVLDTVFDETSANHAPKGERTSGGIESTMDVGDFPVGGPQKGYWFRPKNITVGRDSGPTTPEK